MEKKSMTQQWRESGNQLYRGALVEGLSPTIKKDRLVKAITSYDKAFQTADSQDDQASACKNSAKATWATATVVQAHSQDINLCNYYFKEAIQHFGRAVGLGTNVKDISWVNVLLTSYKTCVDEAVVAFIDSSVQSRSAAIQGFIDVMQDDIFKSDCYQEMATILFHHAVVALDREDFRSSLHSLRECYRPIEEMKRLAQGRQEILDEARVLEADVMMTTASAESLQAVTTGDELLEYTLRSDEDLNMSMMFEVIDWYKKAILLTRELEVEREAIAASRLGKVYSQVLKLTYKAKDYFMLCLELAHSLSPRVFTTVGWFRVAADTLEKYQKESVFYQEEQKRKERQKYIDELKDEREKLSDAAGTLEKADLLAFIYETFPPKVASFTAPKAAELKLLDDHNLKKAFQKAILRYHPDKQDKAEEGRKWEVLCEEITKALTRVYECYKLG